MLYCLWCTTYVHVGLSLSVYHLIPISPHSVSDLYKILCMCTSKKDSFECWQDYIGGPTETLADSVGPGGEPNQNSTAPEWSSRSPKALGWLRG